MTDPTDLSFLDALVLRPTLEEELNIEKRVLEIKATNNLEDLRSYAIALQRQNLNQSHFISTCLEQIAKLQARIICEENKVVQPKGLLRRFFNP